MSFDRGAFDLRAAQETEDDPNSGAKLHTIFLPSAMGQEESSMTIRLADCDGQRNRAKLLAPSLIRHPTAAHRVLVGRTRMT